MVVSKGVLCLHGGAFPCEIVDWMADWKGARLTQHILDLLLHIQGKMVKISRIEKTGRAVAAIALERLLDHSMIGNGQRSQGPTPTLVFGEDIPIAQVGVNATGVEHKVDRRTRDVLQRILEVAYDRFNIILLWHRWKRLACWLSMQANTPRQRDRNMRRQVVIPPGEIVPVQPFIVRQLLVEAFAPVFAIVQVEGQWMLKCVNGRLDQEADLDGLRRQRGMQQ